MAEAAEVACEDEALLVDERAGLALEAGGAVWWLEEVESMAAMAGGGGRPGLDLIGGGRRGSCFVLEGLCRKKDKLFRTSFKIKSGD